jgi:WD40 repeat protein
MLIGNRQEAFPPDGDVEDKPVDRRFRSRVLFCGGSGAVSVWNYRRKIRQLSKPGRLRSRPTETCWPSVRTALTCGTASGELQRTLTTSNITRLLVFSPDGNQLLALGGEPTLDLRSNGVPESGSAHNGHVGRELSPDNKTIATTSSDQTVRILGCRHVAGERDAARSRTRSLVRGV